MSILQTARKHFQPVYFQALALTTYLICGLQFANFFRVDYAIAVSILTAVFTDMILSYIVHKKIKPPAGAYIAGISFLLLVQSKFLIVYFLGGIISQASKYLFKFGNQQIFNPSNVAILAILYSTSGLAALVPGQWDSNAYFTILICLIGFSVSIYAGKFLIVFWYSVAFLLISYFRSAVTGVPFIFLAGTLMGLPQVIFACHMITDPKSSPTNKYEILVYAGAIGILDGILRWQTYLNAPYLALIIISITWIFAKPIWNRDWRNIFKISRSQYFILIGVAFLTYRSIEQKTLKLENSNQGLYAESRNSAQLTDFKLTDVSSESQLNHTFECFTPDSTNKSIIDRICRPNAATLVADINNDGLNDLFFNTMNESKSNFLYLNLGNGKFKDITSESGLPLNINSESPTTGGLFMDFDNDGLSDLFIIRAGCQKLYKNIGNNKFTDISEEAHLSKVCSNAVSINAFDYDNDGYLDIYIGNFWKGTQIKNLTFPMMPASNENSSMGTTGFLLKNMNGKSFSDLTTVMGLNQNQHTWAVGITDINNDGFPDLFLSNDHGPSRFYLNESGKKFKNISYSSNISRYGRFGMNSDIADFNNNGRVGIYATDVTLRGVKSSGNLLWEIQTDSTFKNVSDDYGVDNCGWSWGAKFADFNRDGWLDIFNTTGYWGNESRPSYFYPLITLSSLPNFLQANQNIHPPTTKFSNSYDHQNCLFLRKPDARHFTDVSKASGVAKAQLGKGVAIVDYDNNGTLDIVVASSQGHPSLYKNAIENKYNWIGFKLIGTLSNRDAWGAKIKLTSAGITQSKELYPANGFKSESDPRLYFGLKDANKIENIEIIWPSGKRQKVENYKLNNYQTIVEK